jgi:hypothetical protein
VEDEYLSMVTVRVPVDLEDGWIEDHRVRLAAVTGSPGPAVLFGVFRNAAAHLEPGDCFVVENYVPELGRLPPGETTHVFVSTPEHAGFEEYDVAAQIAVSHHRWVIGGELRSFSSPHRYVWPAELDLMARLAGLRLRDRWSDWDRAPFTSESRNHISVWEK